MCTGTRRAAICSVYLKSDLGPDGLYPWSRDSVRGFDRKRLPLHLGASARTLSNRCAVFIWRLVSSSWLVFFFSQTLKSKESLVTDRAQSSFAFSQRNSRKVPGANNPNRLPPLGIGQNNGGDNMKDNPARLLVQLQWQIWFTDESSFSRLVGLVFSSAR